MSTMRHAPASRAPWIGVLLIGVLPIAALAQSPAAHAGADDADRIAQLERQLKENEQLIRELSRRVHDLEARTPPGATPAGVLPAQAAAAPATDGALLPVAGGLVSPAPPATGVGGSSVAASAAPTGGAAASAAAAAPNTVAQATAQSGGTPATAPADTAQRLTQLEQAVSQMASGTTQRGEDFGMPMHGFADVGLGNHNAQFHEYQGFNIAELDFFLTPRLGPRTRALFELNFEVGENGQVGVDLERAQLGYQIADSVTIWMGRFHTPYGYYNTAFHHGQQIATSLRRPRFIEFEDHGGVMPAHTVGLWLTGTQRLSEERLTYDAFVGNGQSITNGELDMHNAGNTHGGAIFGGNLGLLLGGVFDGVKVGVNAFQTKIENQDRTPSYFTQVRSYGVYAVYDTDVWEIISELHLFNNTDLTGPTGQHHSDAGFAQIGYRVHRFTPYGRYERGAFQQADDYFAAQTYGGSYYREALGVRYDIDLWSAVKFELADTHLTDRQVGSYNDVLFQYAIRF